MFALFLRETELSLQAHRDGLPMARHPNQTAMQPPSRHGATRPPTLIQSPMPADGYTSRSAASCGARIMRLRESVKGQTDVVLPSSVAEQRVPVGRGVRPVCSDRIYLAGGRFGISTSASLSNPLA